MLAKQIKDTETEKDTLKSAHDRLKQQLDEIKSESKLGEEILLNQLKEIRSENQVLRSKYDNESLLRKRLHNMIEDMKGKIRVFCRVRPISQQERELKSLPVVTIIDQYTLKIKLKKEGLQGEGYKEEEYAFDSCFGQQAT